MGANADVIRKGWEAFSRQDLDGVAASFDQSAEILLPDSLPWGGSYRGPDGFKDMVGQFLSQMEEFRPRPRAFLEADDDHVVVPLDVTGRTKAGKEFSGRSLWLYQLRGGKVARAEFYGDTANTLQALS